MSHPTDDNATPLSDIDWNGGDAPAAESPSDPAPESSGVEVEEMSPSGAPIATASSSGTPSVAVPTVELVSVPDREAPSKKPKPEPVQAAVPVPTPEPTPQPALSYDDEEEEVIELVWYVLKVQSSREDTIRDALERRVKIQGLQRYFGRIVVPTEKTTEIRNNKKRIVERKTYPGYIMVEMELNEKTWFVVRETPGVGDFVGAHGTPTKMTGIEVNQMLGQETAKTEEAPRVRIDVERGDRVKIKDGAFENFEGTVEEVIEARGLVKVMLIIFNRPTPVDLEYWQVERI